MFTYLCSANKQKQNSMKLQLTIYDPCAGGAVLKRESFEVVRIEGPFTAPGFFGTNDPFKTVIYKDNNGKIGYKFFNVGNNTTNTSNIYIDNLVEQYKLID